MLAGTKTRQRVPYRAGSGDACSTRACAGRRGVGPLVESTGVASAFHPRIGGPLSPPASIPGGWRRRQRWRRRRPVWRVPPLLWSPVGADNRSGVSATPPPPAAHAAGGPARVVAPLASPRHDTSRGRGACLVSAAATCARTQAQSRAALALDAERQAAGQAGWLFVRRRRCWGAQGGGAWGMRKDPRRLLLGAFLG